MSSIKLKHASGNSMSIAAPATNPASDLSLKLPATVGSANQLLKNSGTAGTLEFASNVTVDSNGRLLVGTTSPGESNGDEATFYNNGNAGITIRSAADADCKIYFSEGTSGGSQYRGAINYDHDTHYMSFSANENERIRILGTGGITFNGDTATANALNDYEEGTWTPECRIETRAASDSPIDAVDGCYTKVGRLVTCHGRFTLNGTPSERSTSRAIEIRGFPFDHNHDWDKISGDVRVTGWETGNTYGTDIYFLLRMLEAQQYCRVELMQQSYNGTRNGSVVMQDNMMVMFTFTYVTT
jgi:hypothetical protein